MTVRKIILALTFTLGFLLSACATPQSGSKPSTDTPTNSEGERLCGGVAGFSCEGDDYCQMAEGKCLVADAMGVCKPRAMICTRDYRPVCGCDGKTYGNACGASGAGVSVLSQGECGGI